MVNSARLPDVPQTRKALFLWIFISSGWKSPKSVRWWTQPQLYCQKGLTWSTVKGTFLDEVYVLSVDHETTRRGRTPVFGNSSNFREVLIV
jgi:hypothetical protein